MDNENNVGMGSILRHKRIGGALALVLIFLATFLLVKTVGEIKAYKFIGGGVSASNTVTVSGMGEAFAVPDIASFSFSVVEKEDVVSDAQTKATQKINVALALLREAGVEDKDIKTTAYNIYPKYEYEKRLCNQFGCTGGKNKLVGYEVNQTIFVKVRDTEKAGEILVEIGGVGVSNVSGLDFTIDDEDAIQREARQEAIENAEQKAKELAQDLGVRIVRVVSFSENNFRPFERGIAFAEVASMDSAGGGAPEIPVGENKVTSTVSITYEIR